jgi:hypothetical protein
MKPTAVKREMGARELGRGWAKKLRVLSETSFPMVAGIVTALAEEV